MKVKELYEICKKLMEEKKGHYDVCKYDNIIGYYEDLCFHHIQEEDDSYMGTLALKEE